MLIVSIATFANNYLPLEDGAINTKFEMLTAKCASTSRMSNVASVTATDAYPCLKAGNVCVCFFFIRAIKFVSFYLWGSYMVHLWFWGLPGFVAPTCLNHIIFMFCQVTLAWMIPIQKPEFKQTDFFFCFTLEMFLPLFSSHSFKVRIPDAVFFLCSVRNPLTHVYPPPFHLHASPQAPKTKNQEPLEQRQGVRWAG